MYVNSNNKTNIAPIPILLLQRFKIKIVEKKNKWPRLPNVYKVYEPNKKSFKNNYVNTKNIKIT